MIFTCDIDQFLCVTGLSYRDSYTSIVISVYMYTRTTTFIPKEIFNMVNINTFNFVCINRTFCDYAKNVLVSNHNSCKWINLTKLQRVYNIKDYLYVKKGKYIKILHCY